ARADRTAPEADRRKDGWGWWWQDKVAGSGALGPRRGTPLGRGGAGGAAALWLGAGPAEGPGAVAKTATALARRAVTVGTDITDDAQVDNLVAETLKAYGKVDVLINNAFRVPSMKPLANTTFEHMRDAIELTVFGALRLIQGFTPALAEAGGSVV